MFYKFKIKNKTWLKKIKLFKKNNEYISHSDVFFKNYWNLAITYNFYKFLIIKNNFKYLRKYWSYTQYLTNVVTFYKVKSSNNFKDIFFLLSLIHRVFMKNGFLLKIIKYINGALIKINNYFFNNFLYYFITNLNLNYFNNLNLNDNIDATELYVFNSFNSFSKDIFPITFNDKIKQSMCMTNDLFDDFSIINSNFKETLTSADYDESLELNEESGNFFNRNKICNGFIFLSSLKYFYFFNFFKNNNFFFNNLFYNNYLKFLYNKNFKINSLTFFSKYFLLLINNYNKFYLKNFINILNNFFTISHFLPKFFNYINFFFKVQLKTLNKKMKKILKNRKKFNVSFSYIKPTKRAHTAIYFFKKYISIADGKTTEEKILNIFFSLLTENKTSWILQIYNKHQIECSTFIRYKK